MVKTVKELCASVIYELLFVCCLFVCLNPAGHMLVFSRGIFDGFVCLRLAHVCAAVTGVTTETVLKGKKKKRKRKERWRRAVLAPPPLIPHI